jgi:hypothetical protein
MIAVRLKTRCVALAFGLFFGPVMASAAVQAAGAPVPQPAVWVPYDLIVRLEDLPKRYSCDDLWYKFRDVLLVIGAQPKMQILPYRCEKVLGPTDRSPSVHLQFRMPEVVHGAQSRWSDVNVLASTVLLEPGHPASLDDSDCELLRQIKATLLAALSDRVVNYQLACRAPVTAHRPRFSISVEALTPAEDSAVRVAARAGLPSK